MVVIAEKTRGAKTPAISEQKALAVFKQKAAAVSKEQREPQEFAVAPKPFSASDLDDMTDDGYRREVIEGRLIVTPSPIFEHQSAVSGLHYVLKHNCPPGYRVAIAPLDWRPPIGDSLQPDLMVIREEDYNPKGFMLGTPLLVVEVRSPSTATFDETEKRARYESLGVPDYWMLDPAIPSLVALHLTDGQYVEIARVGGKETFEAKTPYPATVVPSELIR